VDSACAVPAQIRSRPCGLYWQSDPVDVGNLAPATIAELEPLVPGDEPDRAQPAERVLDGGNRATRELGQGCVRDVSFPGFHEREQGQRNIAVPPSDVLDGNAR
jgi:hypothetical protein